MIIAHSNVSLTDFVLILVAIGYVTMLLKDWRPIKSLRAENKELRSDCERIQGELEQERRKYTDLEHRYDELKKTRDISVAIESITNLIASATKQMESEHLRLVDSMREIEKGLASNTTALTALAARLHAEATT